MELNTPTPRSAHILVAVMPAPGHINPLLPIARHLHDRGHSVILHTAEVFRDQVEAEGLRFMPLLRKANFDYRTFNKFLPEGKILQPGPEEMNYNIRHVFGDTMLDQCDGIREIMKREPIDLILADFTFFGVLPELLSPSVRRPPVVSVGISPVVLSSRDCSLTSGPATTAEARERNRHETAERQSSLKGANDYLNNLLVRYGSRPLPGFCFDCLYTLPDLFLQLTSEDFEFPRTDMPDHVKFVGPVLPKSSSPAKLPTWWEEIDSSKPLVLVTQGTVANRDLNELIGPTLAGLSTEDVTVIAATGKSVEALTAPIPPNARVVSFIPFTEVLPKVDVFVTNGGYGSVNQAIAMGVPIVVAGQTEDKAFVSARVAWSGAGVNLETSYPTPEQVREAVLKVIAGSTYRANARRLQHSFAQYDSLNAIAAHLESLIARGRDQSQVENAAGLMVA